MKTTQPQAEAILEMVFARLPYDSLATGEMARHRRRLLRMARHNLYPRLQSAALGEGK